jgi:acetylornithine/succinyldiaminopimelate/putrescine aminotransferase
VWLHTRDGRKMLDFYGGHAVAAWATAIRAGLAALERQARQMAFPDQRAAAGGARARRARA